MENNEREHITRNLHRLVQDTVCSAELLASLISSGILIQEEAEIIRSKATPTEQAYHFYRIVQTKKDGYSHLVHALYLTNQSGASTLLERADLDVPTRAKRLLEDGLREYREEMQRVKRSRATKTNVRFNVKAPSQLFTGRDEELQSLHKILGNNHGQRVTVITQLTSISGLGGIGKTQLARQYIHKHSSDFDNNIIWINAEREETLSESFRCLAKDKLGIPTNDANGGEKDIATVVADVYQVLENSRALFIFDNAEKGPHMRKFLPEAMPEQDVTRTAPSILITSRDTEWEVEPSHIIKLNEMKVEDAIEFVRKGLRITATDEVINGLVQSLVNRLQCYPLALQQAISYINEQNEMDDYTIKNYLDEFESNNEELLDCDAFRGINDDYERTTFTTWKMTVKKISDDSKFGGVACTLLNCMAFLSAENVERSMLLPLVPGSNERSLKMSVRLLVRYSMVNGEEKQAKLSVHRLVQQVTRIELMSSGDHETILEKVLGLLQPAHEDNVLDKISHATCAWSHAYQCPNLVTKFSRFPRDIVKGMIDNSANHSDACAFGTKWVQILEKYLSSTHPDVLKLEHQICRAMYFQRQMEALHEKLVGIVERWKVATEFNSENERYLLDSQHLIVLIYYTQRKADVALKLSLDIVKRKRAVMKKLNVRTVESILVTGLCYRELMKLEDAMKYFEEAKRLYEKISEEESDDVNRALHNLALILSDMGKADKAVEIFRRLYNKKLHPEWALRVQHGLAFSLNNEGKYDEALKICTEALGNSADQLGETHPRTNYNLNLMAKIMSNLRRYSESYRLFQKSYSWYADVYGESHRQTLVVKADLAMAMARDGNWEEGIYLMESTIKEMENIMGKTNFLVLIAHNSFASILEEKGEYERCLDILEHVRLSVGKDGEKNCHQLSQTSNNIERVRQKLKHFKIKESESGQSMEINDSS